MVGLGMAATSAVAHREGNGHDSAWDERAGCYGVTVITYGSHSAATIFQFSPIFQFLAKTEKWSDIEPRFRLNDWDFSKKLNDRFGDTGMMVPIVLSDCRETARILPKIRASGGSSGQRGGSGAA